MKSRQLSSLTLLGASMLLLTGCVGAADAAAPAATHPSHSQEQSHEHAQEQPTKHAHDDAANDAAADAGDTSADGEPSDAAKMICGPETQDAVSTILALSEPPHIVKTWADGRYTCTYHLPAGALVLSVQESADAASALAYSKELGASLPSIAPIEGLANLGFPGYETPDGIVVFVKDNMTLEVDASALPAKIGPHDITGNALAYQLSTDVLACWTGH